MRPFFNLRFSIFNLQFRATNELKIAKCKLKIVNWQIRHPARGDSRRAGQLLISYRIVKELSWGRFLTCHVCRSVGPFRERQGNLPRLPCNFWRCQTRGATHRTHVRGSPSSILHPLPSPHCHPSTHQQPRIAHMRNFSKLCDFTLSDLCSPLPLSRPALASPHLRDSASFFRSLAIVRKSIERLTHE